MPTPQWDRIPFLCHLTFTGHEQGDIVQVSKDFFLLDLIPGKKLEILSDVIEINKI